MDLWKELSLSLSTSGMELPQVSILFEVSVTHDSSFFMTAPRDFKADVITFSFNEITSVACAQIPIEDDMIFEDHEHFFIFLTSNDPDVSGMRQTANITIIDNDKVSVGFEMEVYRVIESQGYVEVCVGIRDGVSQREIDIRLATNDIDTEAPNDYTNISTILTFYSTIDRQCANITIENDMTLENVERFEVLLDRLDETRVNLMPERAEVIITDDDGKRISFVYNIK